MRRMKIRLGRHYEKRRDETEATAELNRLLSEANSVPLLNKVSVIYLPENRSKAVFPFLECSIDTASFLASIFSGLFCSLPIFGSR